MTNPMAEVFMRLAELERRVFGMIRHGTVAVVDPDKGLMRLKVGEATGGGDFLGPWVPYAQHAGALKAHIPPTVGQQMTIVAPSGDWRQAVAVPMTWSNDNPAPSQDGGTNVITFGDVTLELRSDALSVEIGGVSFTISDEGVTITGGRVEHNDRNIGSTHRHRDVQPGSGNTGVPLA